MNAYRFKLKRNKIFQSMSKKGNCHNNSVMEKFFGIMKQEMYCGVVYYSYEELKEVINNYIKYYNKKNERETRMDESSRIQAQLFDCIKKLRSNEKAITQ